MNKCDVLMALQQMQKPSKKRMRLFSADAIIEFNDITGNYVLVTDRFHVVFDGFCLGPVDSDAVLLKHGGIVFARMNCGDFEVREI